MKSTKIRIVPPYNQSSMAQAGVEHKNKRFITHTTLPHQFSALYTFTGLQIAAFMLIILAVSTGWFLAPLTVAKIAVGILSILYFADILFNVYLVAKSIRQPPEIQFNKEELEALADESLPIYTVLCPLYREAEVLPEFIRSIDKMSWPKERLDVILLLEEDDRGTIEAAGTMKLPAYMRVVVVPDSQPKTKPKACNYGLSQAKGEYVVIYDAEDRPDPWQLKKAYLAFQKVSPETRCLQAKLNYYNPHQNLLTRLFTIEYSLWFDVTLPGLQSLSTIIPLGGTSNHFRARDLQLLEGWDPFNVTEDADLGVRLFKRGFQTAMIDSVTQEEANSHVGNWFRQRSRWIKGYMQTFLVHMRHPVEFFRQHGKHAWFFQLIVGGKILFLLINPIMWILTLSYFVLYAQVGEAIEALFPGVIFGMAVTSLILGNFLFMYCYLIGVARRQAWPLMKYAYLQPIYWLMVSMAAGIALYQLIVKPHYWEKTIHGLHLKGTKSPVKSAAEKPKPRLNLAGSTGLIASQVMVYGLNFGYNIYLSRQIAPAEFGTIALVGTLVYLAQVLFVSFSRTISFHTAYLLGKYQTVMKQFWNHNQWPAITWGALLTIISIASVPIFSKYFNLQSWWPLLSFAPVWFFGMIAAGDSGFLTGQMKYAQLGWVLMIEAVSKWGIAYLAVITRQEALIYAALPVSMAIAMMAGRMLFWRLPTDLKEIPRRLTVHFPRQFFTISIVNRLSVLAFISLDLILVKHYLSAELAGHYAMLSLLGRMVFFAGTLFITFIIPTVGAAEGSRAPARGKVVGWLGLSTLSAAGAALILGKYGNLTLPWLWGARSEAIAPLAWPYLLGVACFTVAGGIVTYFQASRRYGLSWLILGIAAVQTIGISLWHRDLAQVVQVIYVTGIVSLAAVVAAYLLRALLWRLTNFGSDLFGLFATYQPTPAPPNKLRILILNWRDTKHIWAGGAEVYVQSMAQEWTKEGHQVTIFCGNDGRTPRNEVVRGVQVIRRGGHYTVYAWAFLYYWLKLSGKFDLIIDCENGIPFFTPLYARTPIFLVIFHVHQEVFRRHLPKLQAMIAGFIEAKLMPAVYRKVRVVTISNSSQDEILSMGLASRRRVEVIEPGVRNSLAPTAPKTEHPSFIYLGRLKPYKNIDIAIRAFARVSRQRPTATLTIAGTGEWRSRLESLARQLGLGGAVRFTGRVNEEMKLKLLSESWAAIQPSSYEGWGLTVIEANACGTPVIAANVPGLRDSVLPNVTGILVAQRDDAALSKAMTELIDSGAVRAKLSESAQAWAQRFVWRKSARRFSELIYRTLEQNYQQASWPA